MIDENYLEEIFKANYAGYSFNELLKIPNGSVSDDIKCLAKSPYGNECFHLIEAAICLSIIEKSNSLQLLGFNGKALTEAAKKRVPKVYANSVKTLAGFGVLHGSLSSAYSIVQFHDECIPKAEIEALVEGGRLLEIYMADCLTYYKLYRTNNQAHLYPYYMSYKGYWIDDIIPFVKTILLRERTFSPIEELMELKDDLTEHRELLASSAILTHKDLNELQETVIKLREILNKKIYSNAVDNHIIYGETGQNPNRLKIGRINEQFYAFEYRNKLEIKQLISFFDNIQRVSKNTKEDMLRRMDFAIDMIGRYIEQENNKRKK